MSLAEKAAALPAKAHKLKDPRVVECAEALDAKTGELANGEELMFSLSAANPSSLIGYSVGAANSIGELHLDKDSPNFEVFWRPNETLFAEIIVEERRRTKSFTSFNPTL